MRFGICTSIANAAAARDAGWDYVEESAQGLLQGLLPDEEWTGAARVAESALPVLACNLLVPASLKVVGPTANLDGLRSYLTRVLGRAGRVGVRKVAFGSGAARQVPDGFDHWEARRQIVEFLRAAGEISARNGVTIAVEPLRAKESNIINTMAEVHALVEDVALPEAVACLYDSYHVWSAEEPLDNLRRAAPRVRHVHVADLDGRAAPGESGKNDADYRSAFALLKQAGYDDTISVEASGFDVASAGPRVLAYLKEQWKNS